jgi:superfamily II DNA or RNA helicase
VVRFDIYHDVTTIGGPSLRPADLRAIKHLCSYRPEGYQFTQAFKLGRWDGWTSLLKGQSFPTGLCHQIIQFCDSQKYQLQFFDHRTKPPITGVVPDFGFRDYQLEAINAAIKATRGNIVIGTGGGKMRVAAGIIGTLGVPSVLLVNNIEALYDTRDEFRALNPAWDVQIFGDGNTDIGHITIATIQSAYKTGSPLRSAISAAGCIILDECHHAAAKKWYDIASKSQAYYKFGMTGTLNRQDEKDIFLQAFSGRKVCDFPVKWLIDNNYLCPVDITFHTTEYDENVDELIRMSPQDRYTMGIVANTWRNQKIAGLARARGDLSAIVLVNRVEHGHILADLLGAPFVSGKTPKAERRAIKADILAGKITCVIATSLYDESVNNPIWKYCINAAGFAPENAQIQRLGRILRKVGDARAQFHDFYDAFDTKLMFHSKARIKYLTDEGHAVAVV